MKDRSTYIAAFAVVAAGWAFIANTQPERVDGMQEGLPVMLLNTQVEQRVLSVIECNYTPWRKPYAIHGASSFIIAGYGQWSVTNSDNGESGSVYTAHVYIDGDQYPVMRLFIGNYDADNPIDDATLAQRVQQWSNGLLVARNMSMRGGRIQWLPYNDAGQPVDPANWGWAAR